jgi:protocatechuate 3,4-dioxygenase alpha subunit
MRLGLTPSQTVGPYFQIGLSRFYANELVPETAPGRVTISGLVLDGDGSPVPDAILEIWQADMNGDYGTPNVGSWKGWGRTPTDDRGSYTFHTIMPGTVPHPDGGFQAPHINVAIFMRGLLRHLVTRMYFPEEHLNQADPILHLVHETRRQTLIAQKDSGTLNLFTWNVVLQGPHETVFFDW